MTVTRGLMPREYDHNSCTVHVDITYHAEWYPGDEFDDNQGHWEVDVESAQVNSIYWYVGEVYCEMQRDQIHMVLRDLLDEMVAREMLLEEDDVIADVVSHVNDMSEYHYRGM